jgi:hypothetical protein
MAPRDLPLPYSIGMPFPTPRESSTPAKLGFLCVGRVELQTRSTVKRLLPINWVYFILIGISALWYFLS